MVDLSPLKHWIEDYSSDEFDFAIHNIERIGFEEWFNNTTDIFLNCTRTFKDGSRCTQTNDKRYNRELTICLEMIEKFAPDEDKDKYYVKVLEIHEKNIEFEKVNGFGYQPFKKKNTKTSKQSTKEPKPKKDSAAVRKIKTHAIKLNALSFKPKITNNDNTLQT